MRKKIRLTTLTPTVIQSGKELLSGEYYSDNKYFYKLDLNELYEYVFSKVPNAIDSFNTWIEEKVYDANQSQNNRSSELLSASFESFIKDKLKDNNLYNDVINNITNGNFVYYKLPAERKYSTKFSECLKNAKNEVYIPGSTIKGMIRTALITNAISSNDKIKDSIKDFLNKSSDQIRSINNYAQKNFFNFLEIIILSYEIIDYNKIDYMRMLDGKFDILKFIKFSDTNTKHPEDSLFAGQIQTINAKGEMKTQTNPSELIKANIEFELFIEFDYFALKGLADEVNHKNTIFVDRRNNITKENLDRVLQNVYGITISEMVSLSVDDIFCKIITKLQESIAGFSNYLVNKNLDWIESVEQMNQSITQLGDFTQEKLPIGTSLLLASGAGFHSKTILDVFDKDKEYFEILKRIKISNHISKQNKIDFQNYETAIYPTSRKVVNTSGKTYNMGWINFEIL